MPNELMKDLMELGGFNDFGVGFSVECDNCEHYGDITEEQRNSDTHYSAEEKKTCQNNFDKKASGDWGGCKDATLRYIAKQLAELGYVKVTRCGECHNWRPINESTDGGHYCDVDLQAYGVMFNCPPDHFCSSSEPKEAEQ